MLVRKTESRAASRRSMGDPGRGLHCRENLQHIADGVQQLERELRKRVEPLLARMHALFSLFFKQILTVPAFHSNMPSFQLFLEHDHRLSTRSLMRRNFGIRVGAVGTRIYSRFNGIHSSSSSNSSFRGKENQI